MSHRLKHDDCPICGKPESAVISFTGWEPFTGLVCSEECGWKAKAFAGVAHTSAQYRALVARRRYLEGELQAVALDMMRLEQESIKEQAER